MGVETSEARVRAAEPTAYCAPNPDPHHTPGYEFAIKYKDWMAMTSWKPTEQEAWDAALEDKRVVAFESTHRVQDAPERPLLLSISDRDWKEDRGHENGEYICQCVSCGSQFIGHKRRVQCKLCASKDAPEVVRDAEGKHDLRLDVNQLPSVVAVQSVPHPFSRREHYLRCNTCGLIEEAPCHTAKPLSTDAFEVWLQGYDPALWRANFNRVPGAQALVRNQRAAWNAALSLARPEGEAKWISVKDRLPEFFEKVFVSDGGETHTAARVRMTGDGWVWAVKEVNDWASPTSFKFWQHLPVPPKEPSRG